MSTSHHDNKVSERNNQIPQMILNYNGSKGAVDTLNQLVPLCASGNPITGP